MLERFGMQSGQALTLLLVIGIAFYGGPKDPSQTGSSIPRLEPTSSLSAYHRDLIAPALGAVGLPPPQNLEITSSGWLVATYEIHGPMTHRSTRAFAEKAVLAIRNAMYSQGIGGKYRVTLNGPSPEPGLMLQYGSARFIEGGKVEWKSEG
jgi:hypothetical protein